MSLAGACISKRLCSFRAQPRSQAGQAAAMADLQDTPYSNHLFMACKGLEPDALPVPNSLALY